MTAALTDTCVTTALTDTSVTAALTDTCVTAALTDTCVAVALTDTCVTDLYELREQLVLNFVFVCVYLTIYACCTK